MDVRRVEHMRHSYNAQNFVVVDLLSVTMLLLGVAGMITTSRWFICRFCGFSEERLYRWSAFWPLIMFLAWCFLPQGGGLRDILGPGIAAAFGLAFAISNIRIPSWYSRGLGAVFALLHGFLLFVVFMQLRMYERYFA